MKFSEIFQAATDLTKRDDRTIQDAMLHLFEELGELSKCVRHDIGQKGPQPEETIFEAADVLLELIEVIVLSGYTYEQFKDALVIKLSKWEKKNVQKQID